MHSSQYWHRLKRRKSAKRIANNNGTSIELCGTPKSISNQELLSSVYLSSFLKLVS